MKDYRLHTIVVGVLFCVFEILTPGSQNAMAFAGGMFLSFGVLIS